MVDQRQVEWVRAAIKDAVGDEALTDEQLDKAAHDATAAALTWVIGAAKEGMLPRAPEGQGDDG
jgi:hypothetical protein